MKPYLTSNKDEISLYMKQLKAAAAGSMLFKKAFSLSDENVKHVFERTLLEYLEGCSNI